MPRYPYRGTLNKPLPTGVSPTTKLSDLFADLGISATATDAPLQALMALAERHVPGFRTVTTKPRARSGRKKGLSKHIEEIAGEFGPLFGRLAEDAAKRELYALVKRACRTMRMPGGRRYTKKQMVVKISKLAPKPGYENPYYGIDPATLLSWVTHSGPNSDVQKAYARRLNTAIARLEGR